MSEQLRSLRHERDLATEAAGGAKVYTKPWWDAPGEESRDLPIACAGGTIQLSMSMLVRKPTFPPDPFA